VDGNENGVGLNGRESLPQGNGDRAEIWQNFSAMFGELTEPWNLTNSKQNSLSFNHVPVSHGHHQGQGRSLNNSQLAWGKTLKIIP
jgi:hypothetical protein